MYAIQRPSGDPHDHPRTPRPPTREKFEFAKLPIADPTTHTLALYCVSASSREEVDAEDLGFTYSRWMDPAAAEQGPEAFAASLQDAPA